MKKFIRAIAIVLILTMSQTLFGCGQSAGQSSAGSSSGSEAQASSTDNVDNTGNTDGNPTYTIRVALTVGIDNPRYIALNEVFKPQVEEKSGGAITIELYPSSQLGTDTETTEAVMLGNLEMVAPSSSVWVPFDDRFAVLDLPYLFISLDAAHAALQGGELGQTLNGYAEELGVHVLSWGDSGFRGLTNSKRSVYAPADLQGLKLRCMENAYHLAAFSSWGVNPTPMAYSELFTALQQGTVDGQDNGAVLSYTDGMYQAQKYFTSLDHILSGNCFIINKDLWAGMPEDYRTIITDAVDQYILRQNELVTQSIEDCVKAMEDVGLEVNYLTAEQKQVFADAAAGVYDMYIEKYGSELIDIAKTYNK